MKRLLQQFDIDTVYTAFVKTYDKDFSFEGECHDMWELSVIMDGYAGITSGAEVYDCARYDIIIHPSGVFHSFFANSKEAVTLLTISFTGENLDLFLPCGKYSMSDFEKTICLELAEEILAIDAKEDGLQMIKNLLELLLLSIGRRKEDVKITHRDKYAEKFFKTVRFMEKSVDESIGVEDICTAMNICRTDLKQIFKRYTGAGVVKYYNTLRVRRAVSLMREGKSMAQISAIMHFSSQNYFSAFFKRETGVTPSEYR